MQLQERHKTLSDTPFGSHSLLGTTQAQLEALHGELGSATGLSLLGGEGEAEEARFFEDSVLPSIKVC